MPLLKEGLVSKSLSFKEMFNMDGNLLPFDLFDIVDHVILGQGVMILGQREVWVEREESFWNSLCMLGLFYQL